MLLLKDVESYFLSELKNCLQEYPDIDPADHIYTIADRNIPVYHTNLLSIASMNLWFAVQEPCIPANTAIQAISYNLYEHLVALGYETLNELQKTSQKEE